MSTVILLLVSNLLSAPKIYRFIAVENSFLVFLLIFLFFSECHI